MKGSKTKDRHEAASTDMFTTSFPYMILSWKIKYNDGFKDEITVNSMSISLCRL